LASQQQTKLIMGHLGISNCQAHLTKTDQADFEISDSRNLVATYLPFWMRPLADCITSSLNQWALDFKGWSFTLHPSPLALPDISTKRERRSFASIKDNMLTLKIGNAERIMQSIKAAKEAGAS
jgi:hypothetical protein